MNVMCNVYKKADPGYPESALNPFFNYLLLLSTHLY